MRLYRASGNGNTETVDATAIADGAAQPLILKPTQRLKTNKTTAVQHEIPEPAKTSKPLPPTPASDAADKNIHNASSSKSRKPNSKRRRANRKLALSIRRVIYMCPGIRGAYGNDTHDKVIVEVNHTQRGTVTEFLKQNFATAYSAKRFDIRDHKPDDVLKYVHKDETSATFSQSEKTVTPDTPSRPKKAMNLAKLTQRPNLDTLTRPSMPQKPSHSTIRSLSEKANSQHGTTIQLQQPSPSHAPAQGHTAQISAPSNNIRANPETDTSGDDSEATIPIFKAARPHQLKHASVQCDIAPTTKISTNFRARPGPETETTGDVTATEHDTRTAAKISLAPGGSHSGARPRTSCKQDIAEPSSQAREEYAPPSKAIIRLHANVSRIMHKCAAIRGVSLNQAGDQVILDVAQGEKEDAMQFAQRNFPKARHGRQRRVLRRGRRRR